MLMNSHLKFQLRECNKMQMASFFFTQQHNIVKPFMKLHLDSTEFYLIFGSKGEWNYYVYKKKAWKSLENMLFDRAKQMR